MQGVEGPYWALAHIQVIRHNWSIQITLFQLKDCHIYTRVYQLRQIVYPTRESREWTTSNAQVSNSFGGFVATRSDGHTDNLRGCTVVIVPIYDSKSRGFDINELDVHQNFVIIMGQWCTQVTTNKKFYSLDPFQADNIFLGHEPMSSLNG